MYRKNLREKEWYRDRKEKSYPRPVIIPQAGPLLWQRAGLGYDDSDRSLKLEGFRPGACGHGSCLVPVT